MQISGKAIGNTYSTVISRGQNKKKKMINSNQYLVLILVNQYLKKTIGAVLGLRQVTVIKQGSTNE